LTHKLGRTIMQVHKSPQGFFIWRPNQSGMQSFVTYLKNVRAELAHVVWSDARQAVFHTILIIVISTVLALVISGLDYGFTALVSRLVSG